MEKRKIFDYRGEIEGLPNAIDEATKSEGLPEEVIKAWNEVKEAENQTEDTFDAREVFNESIQDSFAKLSDMVKGVTSFIYIGLEHYLLDWNPGFLDLLDMRKKILDDEGSFVSEGTKVVFEILSKTLTLKEWDELSHYLSLDEDRRRLAVERAVGVMKIIKPEFNLELSDRFLGQIFLFANEQGPQAESITDEEFEKVDHELSLKKWNLNMAARWIVKGI